jgi:aldose sugar dehydrogenase
MFYDGSEFPRWHGNAFIGGLSSRSLVRVEFDDDEAREAQRFDMGVPIREVEQGPDGAIWILEDERDPPFGRGRLFRLTNVTAPAE